MTLAIKGHATRGKEVIEILEMLGGINTYACKAVKKTCFYFIVEGEIDYDEERYITDEYTIFTLEEFLEKYPYKVGDKVQHKGATSCGTVYVIEHMNWVNNHIEYEISPLHDYNHVGLLTVFVEDLQPYKEQETLATANNAVFDVNAQCCNIMNHLINEEKMEEQIKIDIPKGYEFAGLDDDKKQVVFTKIGYHYPKTYEECCEIVEYPHNVVGGYKAELLSSFQNLLICRDAYWKIEGWNPKIKGEKFYMNSVPSYLGYFLPMPTAETRDAFEENFEELIEDCKKLLYGDGI